MIRRVLVIPAAGRGSRLQSTASKALVPVNGRSMLDRLLALYREYTTEFIIVASPANEAELSAHCRALAQPVRMAIQPEPTGMLDALLAAAGEVHAVNPDRVWITWCDQIAIHPATITMLGSIETAQPDAALVFPTVRRKNPYIHFERDSSGRITAVRQLREGDAMPLEGESDAGLFGLSAPAFNNLRPGSGDARPGTRTGERNFLPLIPAIAAGALTITFACVDPREAIGVNTPEELRLIEEYLRTRGEI